MPIKRDNSPDASIPANSTIAARLSDSVEFAGESPLLRVSMLAAHEKQLEPRVLTDRACEVC